MQRHVDPVWTWPPKIPGKNQAEAGHVPSYPEKQGYLRVQKDLDWKLLSSFVNFGILKSMIFHPKRRPIEKMIKLKRGVCESSLECVWVYPKIVPVNWGNDLSTKFWYPQNWGDVLFMSCWYIPNKSKQTKNILICFAGFVWLVGYTRKVCDDVRDFLLFFWPPCHSWSHSVATKIRQVYWVAWIKPWFKNGSVSDPPIEAAKRWGLEGWNPCVKNRKSG